MNRKLARRLLRLQPPQPHFTDGECLAAGREPHDDRPNATKTARAFAWLVLSDNEEDRKLSVQLWQEANRALTHVTLELEQGLKVGSTPIPGTDPPQYCYGGGIGPQRVIQLAFSLALAVGDEEESQEQAAEAFNQTDWDRVWNQGIDL